MAPGGELALAPRWSLVGPGRFELPTSRLSGVRSNQLSYGPSQGPWPGWSPRRLAPRGLAITPRGLVLRFHEKRPAGDEGKRNEDGGAPRLISIK